MERSSAADRSKFLDYARGSCGELRTQIVVGSKAGVVEFGIAEVWISESREISAMIQGLIRSLKSN
jgi:four helix bundle protein